MPGEKNGLGDYQIILLFRSIVAFKQEPSPEKAILVKDLLRTQF
jgi:hypothetical protein